MTSHQNDEKQAKAQAELIRLAMRGALAEAGSVDNFGESIRAVVALASAAGITDPLHCLKAAAQVNPPARTLHIVVNNEPDKR